jgi:hypothetical protein
VRILDLVNWVRAERARGRISTVNADTTKTLRSAVKSAVADVPFVHDLLQAGYRLGRLLFAQWPLFLYYKWCSRFGSRSGVQGAGRAVPVIVSLTSYGPRLSSVIICIETLLRQTVRPDRIILWLAHNEEIAGMAATLRRLEKRGLEVRRCPDWRAYKKIIPTIRENPDATIVTADDDVFYPRRWLERLLRAYEGDPGVIHCHRSLIMRLAGDGKLAPYVNWTSGNANAGEASFLVFPTGVGGVLYPPRSLDARVVDDRTFMELSPHGDDIWLKAMSLLTDTQCKQTDDFPRGYLHVPHSQTVSLWHVNVDQGANDEQLRRVFAHLGLNRRIRNGTIAPGSARLEPKLA